jgi:hypothetical protein
MDVTEKEFKTLLEGMHANMAGEKLVKEDSYRISSL